MNTDLIVYLVIVVVGFISGVVWAAIEAAQLRKERDGQN